MKTLFKFYLLSIIILSVSCVSMKQNELKMIELKEPKRPAGQKSVLQLSADPIPTVRIGLLEWVTVGGAALRRYIHMEGVEIKAICDLKEERVKTGQSYLQNKNLPPATEYVGEDSWKEVCERDDIDLIYICTDWLSHTPPIAVYAMKKASTLLWKYRQR